MTATPSTTGSALHRGVVVLPPLPDTPPEAPRLLLSAGTMPAPTTPQANYSPEAFIPRPPWRVPTSAELAVLCGESAEAGAWVQVRSLAPLAERFAFLDSAAGASLDGIQEATQSQQCSAAVVAAREDLLRVGESLVSLEDRESRVSFGNSERVAVRAAGFPTSTVNHVRRRRIGMHIDTWHARELHRRPDSPGRLAMNLGSAPRWLLYINLTLPAMHAMLDQAGVADPQRDDPGKGLGEVFMRTFPDYPIVKLLVAPGEGYVAHTENLVHDGSTEGNAGWDLTLTFHGRFRMFPTDPMGEA